MRIGMIAPPWIPVPPPGYGGTEMVVDGLCRGLRALGHDVVLAAHPDSTCPVQRLALDGPRIQRPIGDGVSELCHVVGAYEALAGAGVDVVHDHTLMGAFVGAARPDSPPIVVTCHGAIEGDVYPIIAAIARRVPLVAISEAHRRSAPDLPIAATIHHGIALGAAVEPRPADPDGYLLFLGRFAPEKGPDVAARVAHRAGRRLLIAAKMREPAEEEFFATAVEPLLGDGVEYVGEATAVEKCELLRGAAALLNPISWNEPFGMVMIESFAAGTPVLAFPCGSAPELVDHGTTGFLCADEDEMVAAVGRLPELDRARCRAEAAERFSVDRMARAYAQLYRSVVDGSVLRS